MSHSQGIAQLHKDLKAARQATDDAAERFETMCRQPSCDWPSSTSNAIGIMVVIRQFRILCRCYDLV